MAKKKKKGGRTTPKANPFAVTMNQLHKLQKGWHAYSPVQLQALADYLEEIS